MTFLSEKKKNRPKAVFLKIDVLRIEIWKF